MTEQEAEGSQEPLLDPPQIHSFKIHADLHLVPQMGNSVQVPAGMEVRLTWEVDPGATVELTDVQTGEPQSFAASKGSTKITAPAQGAEKDYELVAVGSGGRSQPAYVHVSTHDAVMVFSGHATVGPPPAPKVDLKVRSSKVSVDGMGFVDWFHTQVRPIDPKHPRKGHKQFLRSTVSDPVLWARIFDNLPSLTGKPVATFNEFLAYHFVIYRETSFASLPVVEGVPRAYKTSADPHGDAYFFNYNHKKNLGNRLAGDQLVDKQVLDPDQDAEWVKKWNLRDADNYPVDAPEEQRTAARACDFFKFRGRGLCQLTGRDNYKRHAEPFLPKGVTIDTLDDAGLTKQFADLDFCFKVFNSFFDGISDALDSVNDAVPDWRAVGHAVNGNGKLGDAYAAQLQQQCEEVLICMAGLVATSD